VTDTIDIGTYTVNRIGYGAMRITGPGIWGDPPDRDEALRVLRRAVELGANFIDTADSYGPYVSEELIKAALHPYPDDLLIGTKAGLLRTGPGEWHTLGDPKYLRQEVEMSLRRLGLERIGLFQLHRVDPRFPLADQIGELRDLQQEGKIHHIGLSEVDAQTIEKARKTAEIVSVQNLYNLTNRRHEKVVDHCEREGIAFIPWNPVAVGKLAAPSGILANAAKEYGATPGQLALAWLLRRSPAILPIPGTKSVAHLEENMAAGDIELSDEAYKALAELA
jgi:aryl-alcohol dehydrogenase-like predicted oxidoreductase